MARARGFVAAVAVLVLLIAAAARAASAPTPLSPDDGAVFAFDQNATITFTVSSGGGYTRIETGTSPARRFDGRLANGLSNDPTQPVGGDPNTRSLTLQQGAYWKQPGTYYWQPYNEDCTADPDCAAEGPVRSFTLTVPQTPPTDPGQPPPDDPERITLADLSEPRVIVVSTSSGTGFVGQRPTASIEGFIKGLAGTKGTDCRAKGPVRIFARHRRPLRVRLIRPKRGQTFRNSAGQVVAKLVRVQRARSQRGFPGKRLYFRATGAACKGQPTDYWVARRIAFELRWTLRRRIRPEEIPEPSPDDQPGTTHCRKLGYEIFDRSGLTSCRTAKRILGLHLGGGRLPSGWRCDDRAYADAGECINYGYGQFKYR